MWDRTDQIIRGVYHDVPYIGKIVGSRVKYGGAIQHTVVLFKPIKIFDGHRDRILIREYDPFAVLDAESYKETN